MCNKALWPVETRAVCIIVCIVKFGVPNVRNGSSVMAKDAGGGVCSVRLYVVQFCGYMGGFVYAVGVC